MRFTNIVSAVRGTFLSSDVGAFWSLRRETLFQDQFGRTPVTATGQTVGMVADDRYALAVGPELVVDTGFNDPAYWTAGAGWSITGGQGVGTATTSFVNRVGLLTVGRWYQATITVTVASGQVALPFDGAGANVDLVSASGTYTRRFQATTTTLQAALGSGPFTGTIDNISVKEFFGTHIAQATAGSRPTYNQDANGANKLTFDGTADHLVGTIGWTGTDLAMFAAVNTGAAPAANESLIALGTTANATDYIWLRINTVLGVNLEGAGAAGSGITGTSTIAAPALAHVVGGQDDTDRSYMDLAQSGQNPVSITSLAAVNRIAVGALVRNATSNYFSGDFYGGWVRTRSPSTETRSTVIRGLASLARLSL